MTSDKFYCLRHYLWLFYLMPALCVLWVSVIGNVVCDFCGTKAVRTICKAYAVCSTWHDCCSALGNSSAAVWVSDSREISLEWTWNFPDLNKDLRSQLRASINKFFDFFASLTRAKRKNWVSPLEDHSAISWNPCHPRIWFGNRLKKLFCVLCLIFLIAHYTRGARQY